MANVQGTQLALSAIASLLHQHDPQLLAAVTGALPALAGRIAAYDRAGTWTPLAGLTRQQREQLDSAVSSLLEQLSIIPDLLELPVKPATADS